MYIALRLKLAYHGAKECSGLPSYSMIKVVEMVRAPVVVCELFAGLMRSLPDHEHGLSILVLLSVVRLFG
jgi:hypothetical protein